MTDSYPSLSQPSPECPVNFYLAADPSVFPANCHPVSAHLRFSSEGLTIPERPVFSPFFMGFMIIFFVVLFFPAILLWSRGELAWPKPLIFVLISGGVFAIGTFGYYRRLRSTSGVYHFPRGRTRYVIDHKRGAVALKLPGGKWMVLRPAGAGILSVFDPTGTEVQQLLSSVQRSLGPSSITSMP